MPFYRDVSRPFVYRARDGNTYILPELIESCRLGDPYTAGRIVDGKLRALKLSDGIKATSVGYTDEVLIGNAYEKLPGVKGRHHVVQIYAGDRVTRETVKLSIDRVIDSICPQ